MNVSLTIEWPRGRGVLFSVSNHCRVIKNTRSAGEIEQNAFMVNTSISELVFRAHLRRIALSAGANG